MSDLNDVWLADTLHIDQKILKKITTFIEGNCIKVILNCKLSVLALAILVSRSDDLGSCFVFVVLFPEKINGDWK